MTGQNFVSAATAMAVLVVLLVRLIPTTTGGLLITIVIGYILV
jgi:high-affinity K+ transport system ATPase subunit B